ncbi:MAG: 16S rRNA (cytidine(1402)-2'-O)-methyltransferase [Proteobacteria bacterium]|nr:16S rRNA (cytidine(1402)-2'-O)-methyltransferase [Pseudomonadota bacterium]
MGGAKMGGAKLGGGLYIVATPIGNADDITLRALATLEQADLIACEDTRVTGKLLAFYGIAARKIPYHEHNAARAGPILLRHLERGQAVALVSDAGTPLISDPGYRLVNACHDAGIPVTVIPGASAPIAALAVSGLPSDRFLFAGFLPVKQAARRKTLKELSAVRATLVLFESPRRLAASLGDMAAILGHRKAAVARELTKFFEEVRRATLEELARHYREAGPPKGEVVIVVAPPEKSALLAADAVDIDAQLGAALKSLGVRDAAAKVAAATGVSKRELYSRALALTGRGGRAKGRKAP